MPIEPQKLEFNYYPTTINGSVSNNLTNNSADNSVVSVPSDPQTNTPANSFSDSNIIPTGGGSVMNGGSLQSPNFVTGSSGSGWKIDSNGNIEANDGNFRGDITGASGTFTGNVTATSGSIGGFDIGSDYVRDVANSMGLASTVTGSDDVRFWAGASFANRATAPFYVTEAGVVVGTNITANYSQITNQDIFGDGSDGDVTISVNTSLSSDVFYNNLTINTAVTLNPTGYRIFVKGTLTINGTGKIARNGNAGGNATAGTDFSTFGSAGAAAAALADGSIKGAPGGQAGKDGVTGVINVGGSGNTNGTAGNTSANTGTSAAKSIATSNGLDGTSSPASGNGTSSAGTGNAGSVGAGAGKGTRTGTVYNLVHNSIAAYRLFDDNGSAYLTAAPGNGGVGGSSTGGISWQENGDSGVTCSSGASGGSGGGGGNGGIIPIFSRIITIGASAGIYVDGGAGGTGGNSANAVATSGGVNASLGAGGTSGGNGGMGGNGGIIILVYSTLNNSGTLSAAGGSGGTGGTKGNKATFGTGTATDGSNGTAGTTGNTGVTIQLQV